MRDQQNSDGARRALSLSEGAINIETNKLYENLGRPKYLYTF